MSTIAIIDYGAGNLRSVEKALQHVGADVRIATKPSALAGADKLVLPGVGAFGFAMERLDKAGFRSAITERVQAGAPLLGICLGKQLLVDESEESPGVKGFGFIPGTVVRFPSTEKVPHIGWNDIGLKQSIPLLQSVPEGSFFYFVHSYYAQPADEAHVAAASEYGGTFPAIIAKDNIFGIQFHPEKSQEMGLQILRNYTVL